MTLYELLNKVNDNVIIQLFRNDNQEVIGTYDGKDNVPARYEDYNITDVLVCNGYTLGIELEIENRK